MSQHGEWPQVSGQQLMPTENKPGQKKEEGYDVTPRTVVAVPGSQAAVVKGLFVFSRPYYLGTSLLPLTPYHGPISVPGCCSPHLSVSSNPEMV